MKALNSSERQSAFFVFLALFAISIVLITVTVFFGMQVPLQENKQLKLEVEDLQNDQMFLKKFSSKMSETVAYLSNINNTGIQNADIIDGRIGFNIEDLTKQIGGDTTARSKMFNDIVVSLTQLRSAKKALRESSTDSKNAAYYKEQAAKAAQDLASCQAQIAQLAKHQ